MKKKNYFKASFVQVDITPDFQVELIGCMREDNISKGILHRLYGQILLMEFKDRHLCLITVDSLGLTINLSNKLRTIVANILGTDISNIMINFSHTHSAPAPLSPVNGEKYREFLFSQIESALEGLLDSLRPCKIGVGLGKIPIGENRRQGCSLTDSRLFGLNIIDSQTNKTIVCIFRVAAHANVLMIQNNKISSDYFGRAREKISDRLGFDLMIIQGAAGNIKPVGVDKILGGNILDLERISDIFLRSAEKLKFDLQEVFRLEIYEKDIVYKSDVPSKKESEKIASDAKHLFGMDGSLWLKECQKLRNEGIEEQVQKRKIQFLILNDICFCGLPEELFCEIALGVVKKTANPYIFVNGYTNGCSGYLPHAKEWDKGGYETLYSYLSYYKFYGHVMPFNKDTGDIIIESIYEDLKSLKLNCRY